MRRVAAIIQARMGSTRLPGKVLRDVGGRTMLERVINRTRRAKHLRQVVVATSVSAADEPIVDHARDLGVEVVRGDEEWVLDRFYDAAQVVEADAVVRITADCPLIEPELIDRVVEAFLGAAPPADFAANIIERRYPRGLDVEVASREALGRVWREADQPHQRRHVFPYIYEHPGAFRMVSVTDPVDRSGMRWTVDTIDDLQFIRAVYEQFDNRDDVHWLDVIALLARRPDLMGLNAMVTQKPLEER